MAITFCIPTLNRYDLLKQLVKRACVESTVKPDLLFIIDNGKVEYGGVPESDLDYFRNKSKNLIYYAPEINIGCAKSWNIFLNLSSDHIIISNDDVLPEVDSIEKMTKSANMNPDEIIFVCKNQGNAWSFFLQRKNSIHSIGYYDENISPNYAYFEDNDYHYRMKLAGYSLFTVSTQFEHQAGGSATLKQFSQDKLKEHHNKFRTASKNYQDKWGGLPGSETFVIPYDGKRVL